MAQMPIQMISGRADPFTAASPAAASSPPRVAIPRAAYLYDPGGISGGKLRPGSIDQEQFKAYLAAARKEAVAAPTTPLAAPPSAPAGRGIPTLSPAQLAALGIDVSQLRSPEAARHQASSQIEASAPGDPASLVTAAGGTPGVATPDAQEIADNTLAYALDPAAAEPSASEVADAALNAMAQTAALPPSAASQPGERGPIPGARRGADGAWELTRLPDKDEREMLYGQKWRVVESQKSRELFLGPDGEFGWDDFLDMINPLQHIPFVNMAYRAITGDEIYGAARLVDAAFGPLAGASTAVDLAFRDVTGDSMASTAIAAVFGTGAPTAGGESMGDVSVNTASATQLSDASTIRRGSHR
jgi:hypothetical protein